MSSTSNSTAPRANPRPATDMGGKRQLSVRLEDQHLLALQRISIRTGSSPAVVAREAIHLFLLARDPEFAAGIEADLALLPKPISSNANTAP